VQKKKKKKKKEKGKGRRPWAVVKEPGSTVHVAEQWRHGEEGGRGGGGGGEGPAALGGGEGVVLHCSST